MLIIYMQIPTVTDSFVLKFTPLVIIAILLFRNSRYKNKSTWVSFMKENKVILFTILVMLIGSIRNNNGDVKMNYIIFRDLIFILYVLLIIKVCLNKLKGDSETVLQVVHRYITQPLFLLASLNIFFWLMNVQFKPSIYEGGVGESVLFSYLGVHIERVSFPLTEGFNNYSSVIGAIFTLSTINAFLLRYKVQSHLLYTFVFLITLLMIDSRAAILYPLMILGLLYVIKKYENIRKLRMLFIFPVIGPLALMTLLPIIGQLEAFSFLARSSEDLATGNSRFLIWGISFAEFIDFKFLHLFGFGEFGHLGSGASKLWADIFGNWENSESKSPHNTMLVILFDYGYLGLALYLLMLLRFLSNIIETWAVKKRANLLFLGFFLYNLLQGVTESTFGFYFMNFVYLFIALTIINIVDYRYYTSKQLGSSTMSSIN